MQSALAQLESTYFTLQDQINLINVACTTPDQQNAISTQYVQARMNYWACVNKAFHDDDPQVVTLTSQLTTANQQLKTLDAELGDIAKVLTDITTAVTLGTQLATKVIAV